MLMWLLLWEKLHPAILGPLLIVFGAVGLFQYPPFSWHQAVAGISLMAGIPTFINGVKQLTQPQPDEVTSAGEQIAKGKDTTWGTRRVSKGESGLKKGEPTGPVPTTEVKADPNTGKIID